MKQPKTYEELLDLVNPLDLEEVLDFSGINDKLNTPHWTLRRELSLSIWESMDKECNYWKEPRFVEINKDFYITLLKCIQDYYWWSHKFHHIHGAIYKRVVNALEITEEELIIHFKEEKENEQ